MVVWKRWEVYREWPWTSGVTLNPPPPHSSVNNRCIRPGLCLAPLPPPPHNPSLLSSLLQFSFILCSDCFEVRLNLDWKIVLGWALIKDLLHLSLAFSLGCMRTLFQLLINSLIAVLLIAAIVIVYCVINFTQYNK